MSGDPFTPREREEVEPGRVEGIRLADAIAKGEVAPAAAYLGLAELQARHGKSSAAVAAYVCRLAAYAAKSAAGAASVSD